jgi:hypothetical protein
LSKKSKKRVNLPKKWGYPQKKGGGTPLKKNQTFRFLKKIHFPNFTEKRVKNVSKKAISRFFVDPATQNVHIPLRVSLKKLFIFNERRHTPPLPNLPLLSQGGGVFGSGRRVNKGGYFG